MAVRVDPTPDPGASSSGVTSPLRPCPHHKRIRAPPGRSPTSRPWRPRRRTTPAKAIYRINAIKRIDRTTAIQQPPSRWPSRRMPTRSNTAHPLQHGSRARVAIVAGRPDPRFASLDEQVVQRPADRLGSVAVALVLGGKSEADLGLARILGLELAAVLGMAGPPSPQAQALTGLGSQQRTDHGQQVTGTSGRHASDGVAGLLVGVGDPLQHRFQGRRWRRPRLLHARDCIARTRPCPVHACGPRPGGAVANSDLLHAPVTCRFDISREGRTPPCE
jgi:hypothetical protein